MSRHTKERLFEVLGKVEPDFKLSESSNADESGEQEQVVTPEEEKKAAEMDKAAETPASEENIQEPVVAEQQKGINIKVTVPVYKKRLFEDHLKSLKKLAKRMGAEEPTINIGEVYTVKVKDPSDQIPPHQWYGIDVFDVEIIVDGMFKMPGNYKLVAVVDNITGGSIEIDENEPVPAEYLETLGQCDLCKQERYRGKNFIVKDGDSGEYMVLGSSCVKKYIGIDPSKYIRTLSYLRDFREVAGGFFDEDDMFAPEGGGRRGLNPNTRIVELPKVVSIIHAFMDQDGYEKRKWEQTKVGWGHYETYRTNDGQATADKAEKIINDSEEYNKFPVDQAYVREFLNWAKGLDPVEPKMVDDPYMPGSQIDKNAGFNEYRAKVQEFANEDRNLRIFETALLASAINFFENEKERAAKAEAQADSQFLGQVGEKINIPYAKLTGARSGEGQYGTWYLWEFIDENGNVLKKFGNLGGDKYKIEDGDGEELFGYYVGRDRKTYNVGDVFAFTAEVKKHEEYQGVNSTMLGRLSKLKK